MRGAKESGRSDENRRRRPEWVLVALGMAGLFLLSFSLRVYDLTEREIWIDEANSILIALEGPAGIVGSLKIDGNPPLYYLLLHLWVKVWGFGEVAVRSLSVAWGALLAPLVFWVGRRWFGRTAGIAAALFVAVSPFHLYYSREARMYALMSVLALLALKAVERLLEGQNRRSLIWVVVCQSLCIYTHNYGLFFLPVAVTGALFLPRGKRGRGVLLAVIATATTLALVSPWLPVVVRQAGTGVGDWIPPLFEREIGSSWFLRFGAVGDFLAGFLRSLEVMSPGAAYPSYLRKLPTESPLGPLALFLVGGLALLAVLSVFTPRRIDEGGREARFRTVLLALGVVIPMAIPLGYSVLIKPVYLIGRYEILTFGMLALLVGRGFGFAVFQCGRFASISAGLGALGLLSLSALPLVPYLFGPSPLPPFARPIARHLEERGKPGDIVLFTEATRATVEYALLRRGLTDRFELRSFPEEAGLHRGWYDPEAFREKKDEIEVEAIRLVADLDRSLPRRTQIWLLFESRYPDLHEVLIEQLRERFGDYRRWRSKIKHCLYCFLK